MSGWELHPASLRQCSRIVVSPTMALASHFMDRAAARPDAAAVGADEVKTPRKDIAALRAALTDLGRGIPHE